MYRKVLKCIVDTLKIIEGGVGVDFDRRFFKFYKPHPPQGSGMEVLYNQEAKFLKKLCLPPHLS